MRGLLVKDLRLLGNQKQFFFTVLAIAAIFAVAGQNLSFIMNYCCILAMFFTISTISYDEFNNGYAALFTMPITRKQYVMEKYLFTLLIGGGVWLAATLLGVVIGISRDVEFILAEWLVSSVSVFMVLGALMMVMLPVYLKYGAEKSRTASVVLMFAVFAGIMLLVRIEALTLAFKNAIAGLERLGDVTLLLLGLAVFAVVTTISMTVSVRIMEKKQF